MPLGVMSTATGTHILTMPLVTGSSSSAAQFSREGRTEFGAPLADRFVADDDNALGKEILHVAKTEMEPDV